MLPSKPSAPTAPPYHLRGLVSWSSMNCIAHVLGAPVTVTAHMWVKNASSASNPGRNRAFDVVDGMDQPAVQLDLAAADHLDAARHADPRLVVAVHVGAHRELGFLFQRGQQRPDLLGVVQRGRAAGDRARDRAGLDPVAGYPDVHLRRGPDQVLALTEIEKELIGSGIVPAQPLVERRRRTARGPKTHDSAPPRTGRRPANRSRACSTTFAYSPSTGSGGQSFSANLPHARCRPTGRAPIGGCPGQPGRGTSAGRELVAVSQRGFPLPVDDVEFVRQLQYQVTLAAVGAVGAVRPQPIGSNWYARS